MTWTANVQRRVLANGLTVLVQRHASAPIVAVVTHVKAGYFDEPDEWVGIAHVLEHMFFKGTPRYGPGRLARETQRLGGYVNAGTIYDKTVYYAVAPSAGNGLAQIAELQADALRNLLLDRGELARELEVIVQEARRKLDNPQAVTSETLYAELFRRHRMGRWRIGTPDELRRLTADDLRAYYRTRYTPDRVIVSLVGDLDPDDAMQLAERLWGDWAVPASPVEPSPEEPPGRPGTLRVLHGDVARPLAAFGWRTVGPLHPDAVALDLGADILSAGRTAWLDRAVRDPGLAAAIGAGHYTPGDIGVFDVALTGEPGTLRQAVTTALGAVRALRERGPTPVDLERVRALLRTRWARRLEAAEGRATAFAEFEALGGYAALDMYLDRLLATTADEVRRAAATWLGDGPGGTAYLPRGNGGAWDASDWPLEPGGPPPADRDAAPVVVGGVVHSASQDAGAGVRHRRLPGGDLLARSQSGSGLVTMALVARGLRDDEEPETAGLTHLMVRAALRADQQRLAVAAERLGGSLGAVSTLEAAGWTLTVPPEHAAAGAALLARLAQEPGFADADVAVEARLQADLAASQRDDMYRYPMQRLLATALSGDPYGLPPLGDPERVRGFDGAAVRQWHARWLARRTVAVSVGDAEAEALLDALEDATATWTGAGGPEERHQPAWRAEAVREEREKQQSALAMAFPAPCADDPSRYALAVVGSVLSGLAGRLFEELREKRSLAYTVQAAPWLRRRMGAVLSYIATSPERVDEARDAMLAELKRLVREPIHVEELERARQYAAGLTVLGLAHAAAVRDAVLDGWCTGTLEDLVEGPDRLRAVTADEVQEAARRVFVMERRAEFLLDGVSPGSSPG